MEMKQNTFTPSPHLLKGYECGWPTVGPGKPVTEYMNVEHTAKKTKSKYLGMQVKDTTLSVNDNQQMHTLNLVNNKEYHDVVFFCGKNKDKVYAYQGILASKSPYFERLFAVAAKDIKKQQKRKVGAPLLADANEKKKEDSPSTESVFLKFTLKHVDTGCFLRVLEWAYTDTVFSEKKMQSFEDEPTFGGCEPGCRSNDPDAICTLLSHAKEWGMTELVDQVLSIVQGAWDEPIDVPHESLLNHTPTVSSKRIGAPMHPIRIDSRVVISWDSWHYTLFELATQKNLTEIHHALFVRSAKCVNMFNAKDVEHFAILSPQSLQAMFACESIFKCDAREFSKFRIVAQWFLWHCRFSDRRFSSQNLLGVLHGLRLERVPIGLIQEVMYNTGAFEPDDLLQACFNNHHLKPKQDVSVTGFRGFPVRVHHPSGEDYVGYATDYQAPPTAIPRTKRSTGFFFNAVRFSGSEETEESPQPEPKGQVYVCYDDGFDDGWTGSMEWTAMSTADMQAESEWYQPFVDSLEEVKQLELLSNEGTTSSLSTCSKSSTKAEKYVFLIQDKENEAQAEFKTPALSKRLLTTKLVRNGRPPLNSEARLPKQRLDFTYTPHQEQHLTKSQLKSKGKSQNRSRKSENRSSQNAYRQHSNVEHEGTGTATPYSSMKHRKSSSGIDTTTPYAQGTHRKYYGAKTEWAITPHTSKDADGTRNVSASNTGWKTGRSSRTCVTFATDTKREYQEYALIQPSPSSMLESDQRYGSTRNDSKTDSYSRVSLSRGNHSHLNRMGERGSKSDFNQPLPVYREPLFKDSVNEPYEDEPMESENRVSPLPPPPPIVRKLETKQVIDGELSRGEGRESHWESFSRSQLPSSKTLKKAEENTFAEEFQHLHNNPSTPPTSPKQSNARRYPNSDKKRESPYKLELVDNDTGVSSPMKKARTLFQEGGNIDPKNLNSRFRGLDLDVR